MSLCNLMRSKEDWQRFSRKIGGEYIKKSWGNDIVQVKSGEWTVTVDIYAARNKGAFTRMRAPYVSIDGLEFQIRHKTLLSKIGNLFGTQDIKMDLPKFDKFFIIRGNNPEKIKRIFSIPQIHEKILTELDIHLAARDDDGFMGELFPEDIDELYLSVEGIVNDVNRLMELYRLFTTVLNQLALIGSAGRKDPGVILNC